MTTIALIAAAAILLLVHRRQVAQERARWETRLDAQEHRHNAHFAKLLAAQATERTSAQKTTLALLQEMTAARVQVADERVQLMNRVNPATYQPPLSQTDPVVMSPPAAAFDDDDAYWAARESRDEMVERIERELHAARAPA